MPVENNPVGIRPIGRPQAPTTPESISRREDSSSSSGFRPRTDVTLKNAVDNMTGILSKISTNEQEGMQKLPLDLQRVVQNVMRQAFSMQETLSQGIGSTLESQRFSMEQLAVFSRMLSQFGALVEKGFSMEISDPMQTLLTNLKAALTQQEGGAALEPVLLNKIAFELLDTKNAEDLPQMLSQLLAQLQTGAGSQMMRGNEGESSAFDFLKQMVRFFMPRPAEGEAPAQTAQEQNPQGARQQGSASGQGPANPSQPQAQGQPQAQAQGQRPMQGQAQGSMQMQGQPQSQASSTPLQNAQPQNSQAQNAQPQGQQMAGNQSGGNSSNGGGTASQGTPQAAGQSTTQNGPMSGARQSSVPQGPAQQMPPGTQTSLRDSTLAQNFPQTRGFSQGPVYPKGTLHPQTPQQAPNPQQAQMMQARTQLLQQPIQNTPQAMNAMKELAQFLLKDTSLSPQERTVLQNFINAKEPVMGGNDARHLQNLLRLCQQNVPATIQQAAVQQNLPDLPRVWAFMQLCDMAFAKQMKARDLKRAGKDVADFVASMRHSMGGENSSVQGQRSLNFMIPLYLGDNETSYPSYIHVYDEDAKDPETNIVKKETWFRVCMLTDHIGVVELTSRVYEGKHLDMRIFFSNRETAEEFRQYIPELKGAIQDTSLQLEDFKVGAIGERRFI